MEGQLSTPRRGTGTSGSAAVPVIDVSPLVGHAGVAERTAAGVAIVEACEAPGFFQVVGHGVDPTLRTDLERAARSFFALPEDEKARIGMSRGGRAWRGWFPLGGELTAGVPDGKEGLYFGTDLPPADPRVQAGVPLHGPNLYPVRPDGFATLVTQWMDAVTDLGRAILRGIALGLGLDEDHLESWCADPTVLFRIFHYPAAGAADDGGQAWGVGEHTDYGLLTLLAQDGTGGLEVLSRSRDETDGGDADRGHVDRWVEVTPVDDAFVCNLGDMLERWSGGRFVATPHRVSPPTADRISMPLFLDPGWDVEIRSLNGTDPSHRTGARRWDGEDVHAVEGPYGEYLLSRVARVFPGLFDQVALSAAGPDRPGGDSGRPGEPDGEDAHSV